MKTIITILLFVSCLTACTISGEEENEYGKGLLEAGTIAPNFTIYSEGYPDGVELNELRGNYVLIEFWASWCPDCHEITPAMTDIHAAYSPQGLIVVGVSFDEDATDWQTYINDNGMNWIQHFEGKPRKESTIAANYNIRWIPTLYLIDPEGRVAYATVKVDEMKDTLAGILSNE